MDDKLLKEISVQVNRASKNAERAYWCLKGVAEAAKDAGLANTAGKLQDSLTILRQFDRITNDIITQLKYL